MSVDFTKYPLPRVRHHVSPQSYLPEGEHSAGLLCYPPSINNVIDWSGWFANGKPPTVLDIGCGRGGFLLAHAFQTPDVNIMGIEVRHLLVDWINTVIRGENIPNVHALWYTAANGLSWIPDASIDYVTYLFPDPWPKKRHYKRRLFSVEFLQELHRIIKPGGTIYLASDVPDVNTLQKKLIAKSGLFDVVDVDNDNPWPFSFVTDQQDFCNRKGIPYWQYHARRR